MINKETIRSLNVERDKSATMVVENRVEYSGAHFLSIHRNISVDRFVDLLFFCRLNSIPEVIVSEEKNNCPLLLKSLINPGFGLHSFQMAFYVTK